jgi:monoterpene epsilon-lactone hydrolase
MRQTGVMDGHQNVLTLPQAPDAIELRHLRSFVAVADDLSFSRAAQRLFISQPALSRQIRSLERLVGCDLFRRSTQRVELTLAGEALLARARVLLADLDDAISATRSVGGELAGRMALLWEPWARASAGEADLDAIRAALEELHARFAPQGRHRRGRPFHSYRDRHPQGRRLRPAQLGAAGSLSTQGWPALLPF